MNSITFFQRLKIGFMYCLPAVLACALLIYSYQERLDGVSNSIKVSCTAGTSLSCLVDEIKHCDKPVDVVPESTATANDIKPHSVVRMTDQLSINQQICKYRKNFAARTDFKIPESLDTGMVINQDDVKLVALFLIKMNNEIDININNIFLYNAITVIIMVLLPYILMGDLLGKSDRINLSYAQRAIRANANWWLKFLVALIMAVGLLYTLNPLGRSGSAYHQFFIALGLGADNTLPIYITTEQLVPVLAGFLGWYVHFIGYTFTKLIHHDVISSRVYSLLFRKFIVTYGIALTIPAAGILGKEDSAAFFMFLIGLFPLSAMSMLIEAASKFTSSAEKSSGSLSQLPGISRWQILRLEEEGLDSMASLANTSASTIHINLQVMENLTFFWVDVAQLYTIVGQEAYDCIKKHCLTASEFIRKAQDPDFAAFIREVEGVSEADEISRLLQLAFADKLVCSNTPDNAMQNTSLQKI